MPAELSDLPKLRVLRLYGNNLEQCLPMDLAAREQRILNGCPIGRPAGDDALVNHLTLC